MNNQRKLENQFASRSAEKDMRIVANRWLSTTSNRWMPQTQSDLVMVDYNKLGPVPVAEIETAVAAFPAWRKISAAGKDILLPGAANGLDTGGKLSFSMVEFMPHPFDPLKRNAALAVDDLASRMVVEITDETRKAINAILKDGIEKGKGWKAIGREMRPKIGLNSRQMMASANFEERLLTGTRRLSDNQISKRVAAYERKLHRQRNELIARTEAQRVMSEGQIIGFEEAKIKILIWFALVGHDKECAEFQGVEFPIQATHGRQPEHPNCRCGWLPKLAA